MFIFENSPFPIYISHQGCIVTHSLIDITSKFSGATSSAMDYIMAAFLIIVAGGYAFYLTKQKENVQPSVQE